MKLLQIAGLAVLFGLAGNAQTFTPFQVNAESLYITNGPDGALWFTDLNRGVDRLTTGGAISTFPVPTPGAGPYGIVTGPDGALWFAEADGNNIGRITTGGSVTEYPIPTAGAVPTNIIVGPDNNLWFMELANGQIGQITTAGVITEFTTGAPLGLEGVGLAAGPDGAIWYTSAFCYLGSITTSGVVAQTFQLRINGVCAYLGNITAGPDGALWFTAQGFPPGEVGNPNFYGPYNNYIGRITTAGAVSWYPLPGSDPYSDGFRGGLVTGPDGALWFTETDSVPARIGRITTAGAISEYNLGIPAPAPGAAISTGPGITVGPDQNLWFGLGAYGLIGQLSNIGPPSLSFSPQGLSFASEGVGVTSPVETLTLTNNSAAPVALGTIAIGGVNASNFSQANNCPANLGAGASCTFSVRFTPNSLGMLSAALSVGYNNNTVSVSASLSGNGTPSSNSQLMVNPGYLAFGDVGVDTYSAPQTVTVTNTGTPSVTFAGTSLALTGSGASTYKIGNNTCTGTLASGAQCQFQVTFLPPSISGYAAFVQIYDTASNSPQSVGMNGAGAGPLWTYSTANLTFGPVIVNGIAGESITVTNESPTLSLYMKPMILTGPNASQFSLVNNCATPLGTGIAPSGSCFITVWFEPTAVGSDVANFTMADGAGDASIVVNLSGSGVPSGATVNPTSLFFPPTSVGFSSVPQVIVLTNTGASNLTVSVIQNSDPTDYVLVDGCTGVAVPPGKTCDVIVTFQPKTATVLPGSLQFLDNALVNHQLVTYTGTGVTGPVDQTANVSVTSTPFTYNHASHTYGGTITVRNTGPYSLSGPLYLLLTNLTNGVSANGATGLAPAGPYYLINSPLVPGADVIPVSFTDPTGALITFIPKVLSALF